MTKRSDTVLVQHQSSNDKISIGQGLETLRIPQGRCSISPSVPDYLQLPITPELSVFSETIPTCPNPKGRQVFDTDTGEITFVPHLRSFGEEGDDYWRCERNTCFPCVCINCQRIAYAIQLAAPTHHISTTRVGPAAPVITMRMSMFSHYVRRLVPEFRWVWAAEENPGLTGVHTHGYFHTGDRRCDPGQKLFNDAAHRAGLGRVHYGLLPPDLPVDFFGYLMKTVASPDLIDRYLDLNGSTRRRRLIHASRGYWRDGPSGEPITRAEAERIAYRRSRSRTGSPAVEVHTQIHAQSPSGIQKDSA